MAKKIILTVLTIVMFLTATTAFADGRRGSEPRRQQAQPQPKQQQQQQAKPQPQAQPQKPIQQPQRPMIVPVRYERTLPVIEPSTIVIWITNNNGSQTQVILTTMTGGGYLGPKGEYYSSMPTEQQLKALYGLQCPAPVKNNIIVYLGSVSGVETVVVLTKDGTEYVGPKGERYQYLPTEKQLKLIYGK